MIDLYNDKEKTAKLRSILLEAQKELEILGIKKGDQVKVTFEVSGFTYDFITIK
jgi:hypothetical protein